MKVVTIGRSKENNDIVVNDDKVSRNHLQMIMDDNGNYSVLDLNSTNGTFVNGQRITGQVSLKTTDELKIGDTVLSWQCYFGSQSNAGTLKAEMSSQPHISQPSHTPYQPKQDPAPNRWRIYIIIGAVILLLAGGGIGWKMYYDHKQKVELENELREKDDANKKQQDLNDAKAAADKADKEYADAMREAAEAQAEAERLEKIAAQTNSEKDKKAAELARAEAKKNTEDLQKKAAELARANGKVSELQGQIDDLNAKLGKVTNEKKQAEEGKAAAEKSLELTNQMQKILNSWDDGKATAFCKQKNWSTKNTSARAVITEKFSNLNDNSKKQAIINEMKAFNPKKKEDDSKKTETQSQSESQPVPTVAQPDTNN